MRTPQATGPTAPAPPRPPDDPRGGPGRRPFRGRAVPAGMAAPARGGAARREIEARMAAIVNTAVEGMLTIDEKGVIEWINPAALEAFGYTAQELIGQNVKVLMPPAYHAAHDAAVRRYLETGERRVIGRGREAVGLRKDGGTFPVDLSVSEVAAAGPGGRKIFLGIVRDISQRKRDEQELRQTGNLLRAVAGGTTDAVFVKDRDGKYLLFNEAAARFVGRPAARVIGKDDTELFDPESARTVMAQDRRVMEGGRAETAEETLTAAGVTRVYLATKAPYRDRQGNLIGLIGISHDITDFKKAEELRAAKEAAEAASKAKDDVLATITHELRTPLGAVLLWSKMLRAGQLDEAGSRAAIENIVRGAEDQSRLVNDLLDASQAFHGKMGLEENAVELAEVIGPAVDAMQPAAHAKGVALEAPRGRAVVIGDPTRLRQVVGNLLSNAVKFTPAGGNVRVALTRAKHHARIEITDTGEGISPEFLPRLFDRFTQADTSPPRRHGGLGLGLSIVRHIVELHGGTVNARSDGPGRGAQFVVTLPLAK